MKFRATFLLLAVLAGMPGSLSGYEGGIPAASTILIDHENGILFEKEPYLVRPVASLTKLMTLLLTAEAIESGIALPGDMVKTSAHASRMGGTQVYLKEGEEFTLDQMAHCVAMMSANDAAVAIAEHLAVSEAEFVKRMNERASLLRMKHTRYTSPHGLPPGRNDNRSSDESCTSDLAELAVEVAGHPMILGWTSHKLDSLRNGEFMLYNTNKLLGKFEGMDGLKTGFTREAGFCYIGSADRSGKRLSVIILGAESKTVRLDLASKLLDFGFNQVAEEGGSHASTRLFSSTDELTHGFSEFDTDDLYSLFAPGFTASIRSLYKAW